jgi:hypothetical protein
VNLVTSASLGAATFLLALGLYLWVEMGDAVVRAMGEAGFLLCR